MGCSFCLLLQLILFLLLSLINLVTTLLLVIVGAGWFYLRGLIQRMFVLFNPIGLHFLHWSFIDHLTILASFTIMICLLHCHLQHGGSRRDLERMDYPIRHPEFRYKTEFQSHEPEVIFSSVVSA